MADNERMENNRHSDHKDRHKGVAGKMYKLASLTTSLVLAHALSTGTLDSPFFTVKPSFAQTDTGEVRPDPATDSSFRCSWVDWSDTDPNCVQTQAVSEETLVEGDLVTKEQPLYDDSVQYQTNEQPIDEQSVEPVVDSTPTPSIPLPTPVPYFSPTPTKIPTATPTPFMPIQLNQETPKILGDGHCQVKVTGALALLRQKDPDNYYNLVNKYIGIIQCVDRGSGMRVGENPPRFQVGAHTYNADQKWLASSIVHDACHSRQFRDYEAQNHTQNVPDIVYFGKDAEVMCINIQYNDLVKLGAPQSMLDALKSSINLNYWDIPVDQRSW